jgi:hypothetical protein
METTPKDREANIMTIIYNKINEMIGAGNQLFSMQFPAQPLNPNLYRYNTDDYNSVLTKPFTIAEQEFRLADQLFDVSPITAGSNGEKLSVVYNTTINNFIPKLDYLAPFIKDRAGLGHWLLESSGEKDEKGNDLSRIELCKKLYQAYLEAKNEWNETKNKKFDSLRNIDGGLDEYARWQSSVGMVETEKLNNLYNDVVISGHLHEVLTILGYLNASSIAEELELGKQKMRNSARLSLDESLTVYPIQFSPNNWFKALSPNLNPEDLTMAKESVRDIYLDKQKELMRVKGDLQRAELMSTTPEEVAQAQQAADVARKAVSEAESALIKQYGDGIVGVAKIYFNTFGPGAINSAKAVGLGASPTDAYMNALKEAVAGISATQQKQEALTTAIGNLSALMARKSEVEARDWTLNKETIRQRVNELELDVKYYGELLSGVTKITAQQNRIEARRISYANKTLVYQVSVSDSITGGKYKITLGSTATDDIVITAPAANTTIDFEDVRAKLEHAVSAKWAGSTVVALDAVKSPGYFTLTILAQDQESNLIVDASALLPEIETSEPSLLPKELSVDDAELQGMFSDIVIKISEQKDDSSDQAFSQAKASKWGVSLWFASASGSSSSSSASTSQKSNFFSQDIDIAFRVAKVSFDRGGWFNPNIFKMSHAFSRLADTFVSPGLTVDDIKGKDQTQLSALLKDPKKNNYALPAFPVALAVVKDVTIRVKTSKMTSEAAKQVAESANAASGGFLCFSVSSSSSSKSTSESSMHGAHGEYYYIRIPGPQVIGYFLQMVPKDNTEVYQPEISPDGKSVILDAFQLYNTAPELLKAAPALPALDK